MKLIDTTCRVSNHSGYEMIMNYVFLSKLLEYTPYTAASSQQLAAAKVTILQKQATAVHQDTAAGLEHNS